MKLYEPHLAAGLKRAGLWDETRMQEATPPRAWRPQAQAPAPLKPLSLYEIASDFAPLPAGDMKLAFLDEEGVSRSFSLKALARAFQLPVPVSAVGAAAVMPDAAGCGRAGKRKRVRYGEPGRDGRGPDLIEVDSLSLTPAKGVGRKLVFFDGSHPIERMRLSGGLSRRMKTKALEGSRVSEEERPHLRYCAARLWSEDYEVACGQTGYSAEYGDRVDSSPSRTGAQERALHALTRRRDALAVVTKNQAQILDAICGQGSSPAEVARRRGVHHSTIIEALLAGLDRLVHAYGYERFGLISAVER